MSTWLLIVWGATFLAMVVTWARMIAANSAEVVAKAIGNAVDEDRILRWTIAALTSALLFIVITGSVGWDFVSHHPPGTKSGTKSGS